MRIPPKLKPKNPFLTLQPLYTNPTTGLGFNTTSMELGLEGTYGKKKEWTLKPHIGYNYNAPAGKTALTGGLDASYRGMANPKHTANAVVNLGAGYNANSKLGAVLGWDAGYQFHFGAKNRRKGEIKPGKFAGSVMPYGGGNAENLLMYGARGDFEWRPKFGNKAPFTVFGGANVNFAPATGKAKEVEDTATVYQEGDVSGSNSSITPGAWKDNSSENLKFKPTVGAHLGVKIPLHRIAEHLPSFKRNPLPYPEDPLPLQGDTTYAQRLPELTPGGKSLLGTYDETAEEFKARRDAWVKGQMTSKFINEDTRTELEEFPWQNKSYIPTEDGDDGYALGGTIRTMANGGSLAPNIPTYYQSQGTPIYRDTTALPFAEGGDLDGAGDPMPVKPKLPKLSTNDMTAYIYDTVVKLIEEAKASGKIREGEDLNAMGVTAQILLESGNGKSGLTQKYNNFGGIKANDSYIKRGGKYVGMNASGETTKSKWRIYDTPEEGLRDQISFYLDNPRYRKAGVLTAQSAQEHAQRVQNAGYAGNEKKYARQVMQMANSIPNRIKKSDPAKLQTFVTSYAPAQPAVNPIMPVQPVQPVVPIAPPVQPVQPINAASIPITPQVTPTPAAVTIPGGTVTNSALQAQTAANNAMMTSALNNVANSNINSNIASQQNPSYPITTEEDSVSPQLAQYLNYSPAYPQWPGIDIDTDKVYSKSFNLPKMNKPSRWDHQPMFKKGRSTRLAMPVITDIEATQYPSPISKIVQGVTGYNPNYYENTFDEEGNLVQGELERAREEGRPVEFQKGYSSIQDIFNRRAYNKQLEQMQPVMPLEATIEKAGGGFLASGYGSSLDEYYANGGHMDYSMYDVFENGTYYGKGGQMIKRADGSYSQRGLWDNIRANKGSGKAPTKEMLAQERKINQKKYGGPLSRFYPSNIQEY